MSRCMLSPRPGRGSRQSRGAAESTDPRRIHVGSRFTPPPPPSTASSPPAPRTRTPAHTSSPSPPHSPPPGENQPRPTATMNAHHNTTLKQLNALKKDVARLESGEDTSNALQGPCVGGRTREPDATRRRHRFPRCGWKETPTPHFPPRLLFAVFAGQISAGLNLFKRAVEDYEAQARRELDLAKTEKALMRVATFNDEYSALKAAFERSKEKYSVKTAATAITIEDHSLREHEFANYAERQLDDYIAVGTAALQDLHHQESAMKSAQRRIFDSMNQLGLSRSVIRYIERRSSQDRWIFLGGIVFTIFCIWAILRYLR
ncbi:MAG: hypothetical protein BJ554DRAFT_5680 [Olpidium bornovanus]|uniref:Membrin n=1 Tax=Olpidium bornovanus TaxID=278681 RepID=A0A8H8DLB3_9FUNG|nr:MAG: hypothetical protein BJ554DRAFT_5680 [Olpidium bornovanus]